MLFRLIILFILILPSVSMAEIYKYVDDKGMVTITDDKNSIPDKYKNKAEVIILKDTAQPVYNAPEKGTLETAKETPAKISKKISERLGGFLDFGSIKTWLMLGIASTVLVSIMLFIFVRERRMRCIIAVLALSCIYLVLGSLYFQRSMDKGGDIKEEIDKVKAITNQHNELVNTILGTDH